MQQLTVKLAILGFVALVLEQTTSVSGFPSLFNRPRLFQRNHQQQQPQQQANQQQASHQLLLASGPMVQTGSAGFNPFGLRQGSLVPSGPLVAQGMASAVPDERPLQLVSESSHFSESPYFRAPLSGAALAAAAAAQISSSADADHPSSVNNFEQPSVGQDAVQGSASNPLAIGGPTGEAVDKIERHIGRQLDQSLRADEQIHGQVLASAAASASEYHGNSNSEKSRPSEKVSETAAASGEGNSESESSGEEEMSGPEKRSHQHHEEHHHHAHMPEAFEVHHKKGGKSFQYFHQGHHHSP